MIPYQYEVLKPYLIDFTRMSLMSRQNHGFGNANFGGNYVLDHLNFYSGRVLHPSIANTLGYIKSRPYPDMKREKLDENIVASDILLKDTFRQHKEIESRFRKGLPSISCVRLISDPSIKFHFSISRGLERHLVDSINRLDAEMFNRTNLKPLII